MDTESFPLARMSPGISWLTAALLLLPAGALYLGLQTGGRAPLLPAALIAIIYLFVWLYLRPTRFELSSAALEVVWPIRRYSLPLSQVEGVERITGADFRDRYGWAIRVGAGGLWGGFGLLVTRNGKLRFYISRTDGYVLVRSRSSKPLLITPADPERFIARLHERCGTVARARQE